MKPILYLGAIISLLIISFEDLRAESGINDKEDNQNIPFTPSRTLPVLYITLDSHSVDEIVKEEYFDGFYWFDNMGKSTCESIGSEESPLPLKIKGRGNASFISYDKKPYRIKLDKKASLAGLDKNKHFCLMSDTEGVGCRNLRDPLGFKLGEMLGMAWTSACVPIELVVNGEYRGLYFIEEKIRIDSNRVDIVEQDDLSTEDVTGGWLCELDNYWEEEDFQYVMKEHGTDNTIRITVHSPEVLSEEQTDYITTELDLLNDLIGTSDRNSDEIWEKVDIEALAKYYTVNEIINSFDAFQGSCYFYKDKGVDSKWIWGPLWDFDCTKGDPSTHFYETDAFVNLWVQDFDKFPAFRKAVAKEYSNFLNAGGFDELKRFADNFLSEINAAFDQNNLRWPEYVPSSFSDTWLMEVLEQRINWLTNYFEETNELPVIYLGEKDDIHIVENIDGSFIEIKTSSDLMPVSIFNIVGRYVTGGKGAGKYGPLAKGIFLVKVGNRSYKICI